MADNYYSNQNRDENEEEENNDGENNTEPYQVEQIANILAVTCIFLSSLYTIFAVLLFLCHNGEEQSIVRIGHGRGGGVGIGTHITNHSRVGVSDFSNRGRHLDTIDASGKTTPLVVSSVMNDNEGFLTMENSSQGTE